MKLSDLEKTDGSGRALLFSYMTYSEEYDKAVKKGLPFFTLEELTKIEEEYKDSGLTFQQIDQIVSKKGMILKPATFKKYVGMKLISGVQRTERTERGNLGYYPARIIREITFVKFCLYTNLDWDALFASTMDTFSTDAFTILKDADSDYDYFSTHSFGMIPPTGPRTVAMLEKYIQQDAIPEGTRKEIERLGDEVRKLYDELGNKTAEFEGVLRDTKIDGLHVIIKALSDGIKKSEIRKEDE